MANFKTIYRKYGRESAVVIAVLFFLVLFSIFGLFRKGRKEYPVVEEIPEKETASEEGVPIVDQMKSLAAKNPELVAELIKTWVEQGGA